MRYEKPEDGGWVGPRERIENRWALRNRIMGEWRLDGGPQERRTDNRWAPMREEWRMGGL